VYASDVRLTLAHPLIERDSPGGGKGGVGRREGGREETSKSVEEGEGEGEEARRRRRRRRGGGILDAR